MKNKAKIIAISAIVIFTLKSTFCQISSDVQLAVHVYNDRVIEVDGRKTYILEYIVTNNACCAVTIDKSNKAKGLKVFSQEKILFFPDVPYFQHLYSGNPEPPLIPKEVSSEKIYIPVDDFNRNWKNKRLFAELRIHKVDKSLDPFNITTLAAPVVYSNP